MNWAEMKLKWFLLAKEIIFKFGCPTAPHTNSSPKRLVEYIKTASKSVLEEQAPKEVVLIYPLGGRKYNKYPNSSLCAFRSRRQRCSRSKISSRDFQEH